jgi:FtsH-binding integral membrane protein
MSEKRDVETAELSIWFFCGILLLAYGVVLAITGFFELNHPPATTLSELHPTLWWGLLMTALGLFYTIRFRPRRIKSFN